VEDTIGALGEFGVIKRVLAGFPRTADVIVGPGDDAALVRAADGRTVASTDMLVEGRHFTRAWSQARDVGGKAAAQNFADIAAMGARPTALLVGLAAPPELSTDWLDGFVAGLRAECARAGAAVVGGDTVRSAAEEITVAATALGDLEGRSPVLRSGARLGDVVAMAGRTGLAAAGLRLLSAGVEHPGPCIAAQRSPTPHYAAGVQAAGAGANAMIDVSDGLLADAGHIALASGVGLDIDSGRLPGSEELHLAAAALPGRVSAQDVVQWQLTGGEDHALVATFPADRPLPDEWWPIGSVVEGGGVRVDGRPVDATGWDHYSA
jgi:thiamine-monophosphate kinase